MTAPDLFGYCVARSPFACQERPDETCACGLEAAHGGRQHSCRQCPSVWLGTGLVSRARRTDPETSHAAAERSTGGSAHSQREAIVDLLVARGGGAPLNHWEIDDALGWEHPTAARRLAELVEAKLVRDSGQRTPTGTGSPATAYLAVA